MEFPIEIEKKGFWCKVKSWQCADGQLWRNLWHAPARIGLNDGPSMSTRGTHCIAAGRADGLAFVNRIRATPSFLPGIIPPATPTGTSVHSMEYIINLCWHVSSYYARTPPSSVNVQCGDTCDTHTVTQAQCVWLLRTAHVGVKTWHFIFYIHLNMSCIKCQ